MDCLGVSGYRVSCHLQIGTLILLPLLSGYLLLRSKANTVWFYLRAASKQRTEQEQTRGAGGWLLDGGFGGLGEKAMGTIASNTVVRLPGDR